MMTDLVIFAVILAFLTSPTFSATTVPPDSITSVTPANSDDGGLDGGDVAAIILGCLLLLLVIGTIILCVLFQKGYLGNREDQVLPLFPNIYTTPESLRQFSAESMSRSSKKRKYQYKQREPIIFMHDDIFHPPKSRPLPTDGTKPLQFPELELPIKVPRRHRSHRRSSRKRRHSSWNRHDHSQMTSPKSVASYPDDAVFISDKGGMKFTMYYERGSPYAGRDVLSKTL